MSPTPISLLERLRLRPDSAAWDEFARLYTPFIRSWVSATMSRLRTSTTWCRRC
ncbi:MAG: hypothetical protein U0736_17555 [Gemmataceae bacterium]